MIFFNLATVTNGIAATPLYYDTLSQKLIRQIGIYSKQELFSVTIMN